MTSAVSAPSHVASTLAYFFIVVAAVVASSSLPSTATTLTTKPTLAFCVAPPTSAWATPNLESATFGTTIAGRKRTTTTTTITTTTTKTTTMSMTKTTMTTATASARVGIGGNDGERQGLRLGQCRQEQGRWRSQVEVVGRFPFVCLGSRMSHLPFSPSALAAESSKSSTDKVDDDSDDSDDSSNVSFQEYASAIQSNSFEVFRDGQALGRNGEWYVALQFLILLFIALGDVPLFGIGHLLSLAFGPGFILVGLAVAYLAAQELGTALSPWPVPARSDGGQRVRTGGVYSFVRHPMYSGLLLGMIGLSVTTDSASRLILTAVLTAVLNLKATYEETKLIEEFGDEYMAYMDEVKGRIWPDDWATNVSDFVRKLVE